MDQLKIAVIVGSTRPGRQGKAVAHWVVAQARGRGGATYELVDLLDHPLPLLDEPVPAARGQYTREHTEAWSQTISSYDGFVFVTPEYNHSLPGGLKNALDYLYAEWNNKAAAFVGYGVLGAARAVEHLRAVSAELQLAGVRQQLSFLFSADFESFSEFSPGLHQRELAATMFDQLEAWARALRELRTSMREAA
jgi:NAD(P)H-dependent FMN reductase